MKRCSRVENGPEIYQRYHDEEWGKPVYDDPTLFEMLILESFHTGLSWLIILKKRNDFRKVFDYFDVNKVANYDEKKVQSLLQNEKIVRSEAKIRATISNAAIFLDIQKEYGTFSEYLWSHVHHRPILDNEGLTHSELSDQLSHELKKRGFKFMGSVTMYAFLQAVGVINAHQKDCFLSKEEN